MLLKRLLGLFIRLDEADFPPQFSHHKLFYMTGSILSNCGRARDDFEHAQEAFMGTNTHERFMSMLMEASRAQCWSTMDTIWAKIIKGKN